ncbi:hypothetical protein B0O99DRAFT_116647 [Bisporella sp. PMI_857]|nr:hypothetical protein B0O99DRAFT_116647 [Bisporella sp. PMI_857]
MPLRPDRLMRSWSTTDSPILPFLAPRAFAPWPFPGRRAHSGSQAILNTKRQEGYSCKPQRAANEVKEHTHSESLVSKSHSGLEAKPLRIRKYMINLPPNQYHQRQHKEGEGAYISQKLIHKEHKNGFQISPAKEAQARAQPENATKSLLPTYSTIDRSSISFARKFGPFESTYGFVRLPKSLVVPQDQVRLEHPTQSLLITNSSTKRSLRRVIHSDPWIRTQRLPSEHCPKDVSKKPPQYSDHEGSRIVQHRNRSVHQSKPRNLISVWRSMPSWSKRERTKLAKRITRPRLSTKGSRLYYILGSKLKRRRTYLDGVIKQLKPVQLYSAFEGDIWMPPRATRRRLSQIRVVHAIQARKQALSDPSRGIPNVVGFWTPITEWEQSWHKRFSLIEARHTGCLSAWPSGLSRNLKVRRHKFLLPNRLKRNLMEHESSETLHHSWINLPRAVRARYWLDLMCTTLQYHPQNALKVLVGTYTAPYPPGYAVGNCLDSLISRFLLLKQSTTKICGRPQPIATVERESLESRAICQAVLKILHAGPGDVWLRSKSLYVLIKNLDIKSLKRLYSAKQVQVKYWNQYRLIQLAYRFAQENEPEIAIRVLGQIKKQGVDFNSPSMLNLFSELLQLKRKSRDNVYSDSDIWKFVTSCGLKPTIYHYNILIKNSSERGDFTTGWAIHDAMIQDGMPPDAVTYSTLLTAAKARLDLPTIQRILSLIEKNNIPLTPYVATDYLHYIYLFYRHENESSFPGKGQDDYALINRRSRVFERILPVFRRYFDVKPLAAAITSVPEPQSSTDKQSDTKMEPPSEALNIMFTALFYGITTPNQVAEAYAVFRGLLFSCENPRYIEILHRVEVYNGFLTAFGRFTETLDRCPKVVEDMLTLSKIKTGSVQSNNIATTNWMTSIQPVAGKLKVEPNTRTWNILLNIYMSHQQSHAAQRVLEIMRQRGIRPTPVTWGIMAMGYSKLQDIDGTLNAVNELNRAAAADSKEYTYGVQAMGNIRNTKSLYATMEAMENQRLKQAALPMNSKGGSALAEETVDER